MARRVDIVITPPPAPPAWEDLPEGARRVMLALVGRCVERLQADGVQVWLPAGEGVAAGD